jgi:hypothetical protein
MANQNFLGGGAKAGGSLPPHAAAAGTPTRRKLRGSNLSLQYGTQTMKAYPLTEDQLHQLAHLGTVSTVSFALASGFLGFALSTYQNTSLANDISSEKIAEWSVIMYFCFFLAAFFYIIGIVFKYIGHSRLGKIKSQTTFN